MLTTIRRKGGHRSRRDRSALMGGTIARRLIAEGAKVIVAGRRREKVEPFAGEIGAVPAGAATSPSNRT